MRRIPVKTDLCILWAYWHLLQAALLAIFVVSDDFAWFFFDIKYVCVETRISVLGNIQ